MIFRRRLEPFDDLFVDVDLLAAIRGFRGEVPKPEEIEPVFTWIDCGYVGLRAISPLHYLTQESEQKLWDNRFVSAHGTAKAPHQKLVALARLYLESLGKRVCFQGNSFCSYGAGWADACVPGEEYFVECGSMRTNKPIEAMWHRQTLLILPYERGASLSDEELDEIANRPPRLCPPDAQEGPLLQYVRRDYVQLAFELHPMNEEPRKQYRRSQMVFPDP